MGAKQEMGEFISRRLLQAYKAGDNAAGEDMANLIDGLVTSADGRSRLKLASMAAKISGENQKRFESLLDTELTDSAVNSYYENFGLNQLDPQDPAALLRKEAVLASSLLQLKTRRMPEGLDKTQMSVSAARFGLTGKHGTVDQLQELFKTADHPNSAVGGRVFADAVPVIKSGLLAPASLTGATALAATFGATDEAEAGELPKGALAKFADALGYIKGVREVISADATGGNALAGKLLDHFSEAIERDVPGYSQAEYEGFRELLNTYASRLQGPKGAGETQEIYLARRREIVDAIPTTDYIKFVEGVRNTLETDTRELQLKREPFMSYRGTSRYKVFHPALPDTPLGEALVDPNDGHIAVWGLGVIVPPRLGMKAVTMVKKALKEDHPGLELQGKRISGVTPGRKAFAKLAVAGATGMGLSATETQALGFKASTGSQEALHRMLITNREDTTYEKVTADPRFQAQTPEMQQQILAGYWDTYWSRDPRLAGLSTQQVLNVKAQVLGLGLDGAAKTVAHGVKGFVRTLGVEDLSRPSGAEAMIGEAESAGDVIAEFIGAGAAYGLGSHLVGAPAFGGMRAPVTKLGMIAKHVGGASDATLKTIAFGGRVAENAVAGAALTPAQDWQNNQRTLQLLAEAELDQPTRDAELKKVEEFSYTKSAAKGAAVGLAFDFGWAGMSFALRNVFAVPIKLGGNVLKGAYDIFKTRGMMPEAERIAAGRFPSDKSAVEEALAQSHIVMDEGADLISKVIHHQPKITVLNDQVKTVRIFLKDGSEVGPRDLELGRYNVGKVPDEESIAGYKRLWLTEQDISDWLDVSLEEAKERFWVRKAGNLKGKGAGYKVTDKFIEDMPNRERPVRWMDVAEIHGSQRQINQVFRTLFPSRSIDFPKRSTGITPKVGTLDPHSEASGFSQFRVGNKFVARSGAERFEFDSQQELDEFLAEAIAPNGPRVESQALEEMGNLGINGEPIVHAAYKSYQKDLETLAQAGENMPKGLNQPPPQLDKRWTLGEEAQIFGGRKLGVPKQLFLRAQQITGLPLYDHVWQPLDAARRRTSAYLEPQIERLGGIVKKLPRTNPAQREGYALALQEFGEGRDKLIEEFKLDKGILEEFENYGTELFSSVGLRFTTFMRDQLPKIRSYGGVDKVFKDPAIPPEVKFFMSSLQDGAIPWWKKKQSVVEVMNALTHRVGFHKEVEGTLKGAEALARQFNQGQYIPPQIAHMVQNYVDAYRGKPTIDDKVVFTIMGKISQKLARNEDVTSEQAIASGRKLFGHIYAFNYAANMSYRTAAVMRQFMQTVQTTYPRFGGWALLSKNGAAMRMGTKEGMDMVHRSGALLEEVSMVEEGVKPKGGRLFRTADNVQRALASLAQDSLFQRHKNLLSRAITEDTSWNKFMRKTSMVFYHPIVQNQVRQLLREGKIEQARLRLMREAAEDTQWLYARAERPEIFRGVGGRLLGQYGVWPVYYGEYMAQMYRGGPIAGTAAVGRWVAGQALMYGTMAELMGADISSWIFFGPLSFAGGPLFQMATDIPKVMGDHVESDLARARLKRAPMQFVPGWQAGHDLYDAFNAEDAQSAAREFLTGFPELK